MSVANVMSAGRNIAQAEEIQALWEALEPHMKYWSNSVAVTPRLIVLKNGEQTVFLQRGTLLFSSLAQAFLCL